MKRFIIGFILIQALLLPVNALELEVPEVPEHAAVYMPSGMDSFGLGLLEVLKDALLSFRPDLKEAAGICIGIGAAVMLVALLRCFPGASGKTANLVCAIAVAGIMLEPANALVRLGADTVKELSDYGNLLIPVLTAALAAQGGVGASGSLYAGTIVCNSILGNLISRILTPLIYVYLVLATGSCALDGGMLKRIQGGIKWLMTWSLKVILYVFTGFMAVTGTLSGATDASLLKAAKLTISGSVPVIGGILSDASEAVLVGIGTVKNAAGVYGMFAVVAILIGPFLKVGAHYLLLKAMTAVCGFVENKHAATLVGDFSTAMGMLLGMTGTMSLMLLISIVCFMKGAV